MHRLRHGLRAHLPLAAFQRRNPPPCTTVKISPAFSPWQASFTFWVGKASLGHDAGNTFGTRPAKRACRHNRRGATAHILGGQWHELARGAALRRGESPHCQPSATSLAERATRARAFHVVSKGTQDVPDPTQTTECARIQTQHLVSHFTPQKAVHVARTDSCC